MSSEDLLAKIKKLREITGVGFKDCKNAIDEASGDINKSIEILRKKGIAKANKRMGRVAAEGLIAIYEEKNKFSMIEINSETDFVAKNNDFIKFAEELSKLSIHSLGKVENLLKTKMKNNKIVEENLVSLISKIGEKITLRRSAYVGKENSTNFSYIHAPLNKNTGKLGVLLSLETNKKINEMLVFGKQLSMQIAATAPISIDKDSLDPNIINKEKEIITEELKNSGKDPKIVDKIAMGKLNKFIDENTLLNQEWIMDTKKKVKDVLKEAAGNDTIKIIEFVRFKVGEGI